MHKWTAALYDVAAMERAAWSAVPPILEPGRELPHLYAMFAMRLHRAMYESLIGRRAAMYGAEVTKRAE